MLGFERIFDRLIQLLIGTGSFRRVQIASAFDATFGCAEVQRRGDDVEVAQGEELEMWRLVISRGVCDALMYHIEVVCDAV